MSPLQGWSDFYLIVGGAAGALIGLQFVVITLISQRPNLRLGEATKAFSTPTIVHFTMVLLFSALIVAPWKSVDVLFNLWGLMGLGGLVYSLQVGLHLTRQLAYKPEFSDWFFYLGAPAFGYLILFSTIFMGRDSNNYAAFGVAFAMLILLASGIHNAWDAIVYHVVSGPGSNFKTAAKTEVKPNRSL